MRIQVHNMVTAGEAQYVAEDVKAAFIATLRHKPLTHVTPAQWVGVGIDPHGRFLEYAAVQTGADDWLIFHAMPATEATMRELVEVGKRNA